MAITFTLRFPHEIPRVLTLALCSLLMKLENTI